MKSRAVLAREAVEKFKSLKQHALNSGDAIILECVIMSYLPEYPRKETVEKDLAITNEQFKAGYMSCSAAISRDQERRILAGPIPAMEALEDI